MYDGDLYDYLVCIDCHMVLAMGDSTAVADDKLQQVLIGTSILPSVAHVEILGFSRTKCEVCKDTSHGSRYGYKEIKR